MFDSKLLLVHCLTANSLLTPHYPYLFLIDFFNLFVFFSGGNEHGHSLHWQTKVIMDNLMADVYERLTREAAILVKYSKKRTLKAPNIRTAVKFVFPGQLAQYAMDEGQKAINKFFG